MNRFLLAWAIAGCTSPTVTVDAGSADAGSMFDAGSDAGPDAGADAASPIDVYDPDHLLTVSFEIPQASWDALRAETRDYRVVLAGDCLAQPFGSPFTWFEASMTIDGTVFQRVDVRKKGFLGSLSPTRPGLKVDIGEFVDGQEYGGMRRLTLNNSREDPSYIGQCLTYGLFRRAGVPAPRCSFARVEVNGEDLGVYVNVEPVNNAFLRRVFGGDDGNLYEGTLSDFRPEMIRTYEPKNNGEELNRPELFDFAEVLAIEDDAEFMAAVGEFLDVDSFLTFWAMESLIQHGDGYNAFRNNTYIYRDPASGVFRFIPWGTDIVLRGSTGVQSVYVQSVIANRLYRIDSVRARYFARLDELLEDVWLEAEIQSEIDRMRALIEEPLGSRAAGALTAIESLSEVVQERRGLIRAELESGAPAPGPLPAPFQCRP